MHALYPEFWLPGMISSPFILSHGVLYMSWHRHILKRGGCVIYLNLCLMQPNAKDIMDIETALCGTHLNISAVFPLSQSELLQHRPDITLLLA